LGEKRPWYRTMLLYGGGISAASRARSSRGERVRARVPSGQGREIDPKIDEVGIAGAEAMDTALAVSRTTQRQQTALFIASKPLYNQFVTVDESSVITSTGRSLVNAIADYRT